MDDLAAPDDRLPERAGRPPSLAVAAVSVGLQALVIVVVAVLEALHLTPGRATMAVTTALFLAAYGVGLGWCAWGLATVSSWARGPVMMAQLIMLGLAFNIRSSNTPLSIVLAAVAVLTLVAVLSTPSREALETS